MEGLHLEVAIQTRRNILLARLGTIVGWPILGISLALCHGHSLSDRCAAIRVCLMHYEIGDGVNVLARLVTDFEVRAGARLVGFLDGLVRSFDALAEQYGVEKIKTVGDSYMAAAGFDGRAHRGALVVDRAVAAPVAQAFGELYAARFPVRRMLPIEAYGGSDFASIEADNTSAFNCRSATGSTHWSEHAYGEAIDIDPIENPYVDNGTTSHPASRPYVDRARVRTRPGVIADGGPVTRAFARIGWGWGGRWSGPRDYQHVSASGR